MASKAGPIIDKMITHIDAMTTPAINGRKGPPRSGVRGLTAFLDHGGSDEVSQDQTAIQDWLEYIHITVVGKDIDEVREAIEDLGTLWVSGTEYDDLVLLDVIEVWPAGKTMPVQYSGSTPLRGEIEIELTVRYSY